MDGPRGDVTRAVVVAALAGLMLADGLGDVPDYEMPGTELSPHDPDGVFCEDCREERVPNEDGRCPVCGRRLTEP